MIERIASARKRSAQPQCKIKVVAYCRSTRIAKKKERGPNYPWCGIGNHELPISAQSTSASSPNMRAQLRASGVTVITVMPAMVTSVLWKETCYSRLAVVRPAQLRSLKPHRYQSMIVDLSPHQLRLHLRYSRH